MHTVKRAARRSVARTGLIAGAFTALLFISGQASAAMIASFSWVDVAHSASSTPSGSLTLALPDSITNLTFDTGTLTAAAAREVLTGFTYTFSNGLSVGLADLTNFAFSAPIHWATSSATHGGFGNPGVDLITGFTFSGSKVFAGDPRAANFQIANPAGLLSNVGQASNGLTPFVGAASNDAGYWKLDSLLPTAPTVPLPAALPLLLSGLGLLGGVVRRRRLAAPAV